MKKVLIIETDLLMGMGYMRTLIVAGFDVERVASDSKAVEAIGRFKPDAVVLNLTSSNNRSLKLLKWIRSESENRELPVVAFSRENVSELLASAQLAGANECCAIGPAGAPALLAAVRKVLDAPAGDESATAPPVEAAKPSTPPTSPVGVPLPSPPAEAEIASAPPLSPPKPKVGEEPASGPTRTVLKLKELSHFLLKSENKATRPPLIAELLRKTQDLATDEMVGQALPLTRVAGALVALLKHLAERPEAINASSMRTVNQAIGFLDLLLKQPPEKLEASEHSFKILAVDDEVIARKAVVNALELVRLKPETANEPSEALELSKAQRYDLFVLDVNMPGMTGFELCGKLRASSTYKETPVIFVTASDNFDSRLRFARSGGDDFIAKPFLVTELAAKALIHLLDRRLRPNKT